MAKIMEREKIRHGIDYIPATRKISIEFPEGCICGCYCCDEPDDCPFCNAVQKQFTVTERDASGYNVMATKEEFVKFLEAFLKSS